MCLIRKIFPFKSPCPLAISDPEPVAQAVHDLGCVDSVGGADRGHDRADRSSSGENSSSPIAFAPLTAARPKPCVAARMLRPALPRGASRRQRSAPDDRDRGSERRRHCFACAFRVRSQSMT